MTAAAADLFVAVVVAGAAVVAIRAFEVQRDGDALWRAGRAGVGAAWWALVPALCRGAVDDHARRAAFLAFAGALGAGAWPATTGTTRRSLAAVAALVSGAAALAVIRPDDAAVAAAAVVVAVAVSRARGAASTRLRFALHLTSMLGWCAVVAPLLASATTTTTMTTTWALPLDPAALAWAPAAPSWALAGLLVTGGAVGVGVAAGALLRGGGTPDPTDPPEALCTTGPYARVRHPMYVGEVVIVAGSAAALGTVGALLWAGTFAVAIVVVAAREDRALAARHGDAWLRFARRVPAWRPRRR
jgi:protein-S-isoprenylcysteine O-methyltransferase Ste14